MSPRRRTRPTSASSSTTPSGPAPASRSRMVERLAEIPNVVGLKWATPRTDAMEFEDVVSHFSERLTRHRQPPAVRRSATCWARAPSRCTSANYWPEWGVRLIDDVGAGR